MTLQTFALRPLILVLGLIACNGDADRRSPRASSPALDRDSARAADQSVSDTLAPELGAHRAVELIEAATAVVGFLQGKVEFERIRLADTVSLYLGRDEGGTRRDVAGEQLRDRSNWAVQSTGLRHRYSLVPPARTAELTTRVGRHVNCLDYPLASTLPELARFPHVGTRLMYGTDSCLQSWNLTLIFDPHTKPPTVIAALYDQFEW